jgi:2-oxoacid:acceptor oxidoreductase gamma subunit (pyruvate/2-ketoisovalerate family)
LIEVRWHGRGGQGAVVASEILAKAAIREGKWAQAFPMFGPERRGAPVLAFTRIDDEPILIWSGVYEPDVVVVLDPRLPRSIDVGAGLKPEGVAIFNSDKEPAELKEELKLETAVATVDAAKIALEELKSPFVNTAMLGAFARATGVVSVNSLKDVTKETFPGEIGVRNARVIDRAFAEVKMSG